MSRLFAMRHRAGAEEEDEYEDDDEDDEDDDDDEETDADALAGEGDEALDAEPKPKPKAKKAKKAKKKKSRGGVSGGWQSRFEPSIVKEQMLTAEDDEIRATDWPERMQLNPRYGGKPEDPEAEAKWILDRLMGLNSVRDVPTYGGDLLLTGWADDVDLEQHRAREHLVRTQNQLPKGEVEAVTAAIVALLKAVHEDGLEVAFVAQNMRDVVEPLMRGRRDDSRPPPRDANGAVLERRVHRRDVIHEIMEWDRRFSRLAQRRKEMMKKIDAAAEILERDAAPEQDLSFSPAWPTSARMRPPRRFSATSRLASRFASTSSSPRLSRAARRTGPWASPASSDPSTARSTLTTARRASATSSQPTEPTPGTWARRSGRTAAPGCRRRFPT